MLTQNDHYGDFSPSFVGLSEAVFEDAVEAALEYRRRRLIVTPLHGKRPILKGWQERQLSEDELPDYFVDGRNLGIVLGGAAGLVDVDLDNPVAVDVADLLLPDTVKSGRMKNPRSHHWFVCDPAPPSRRYFLTKPLADRLMIESGEAVLVELRSTGHQTVVAPSIHPVDGDRYLWYPGEIREMDGGELAGLVLDVAVATLLALHRPLGSREWFLIHAFGFLCPRLGPERAEKIVEAASAHFDDEEHDERMLAVRSFLRKPVDDDAPMMEGLLAAELERLAPGVPALIERWCARDRREGGGEVSQVEDIIRYAREGAWLFHAPDGTAYAAVEVDGHLETHAIRSGRFRDWILIRFLQQHGRAPNSQLLADALNTIRAIAVYQGPEMPVFVRVAEHEGDVYIDLANENWDAVRVTREGFEVVPHPPVGFVRKAGFARLPYPVDGGTIDDLRPFVNIRRDEDFMLVAAWAAFSLSPRGPYPVLVLQGEQGSAKSTTVRVLRALVDPAVEPLRALPRSERDLAIATGNAWVLAFDNLSGIRDWLSDALCRLATGGGFATRQLYTDDEEIVFSAKRPIILNGIDDIATRGDLQERSVLVSLPSILEDERREENTFWAEFEAVRPRIFGALLSGISAALRNADDVHLERKPRMADFAVAATAMEDAFGWEPGSFIEAYEANRQQASETLLANEPIAEAIEKLLDDYGQNVWVGTATELLQFLGYYVNDSTKRSKAWPGGPQVLSRRLKRIAPALRSAGIEYTEHEQGHRKRKVKVLRKLVRGDEQAQDSGEEVREDDADPEGEAADGEEDHEEQADSDGAERRRENPFRSRFDKASEPEDQGAE